MTTRLLLTGAAPFLPQSIYRADDLHKVLASGGLTCTVQGTVLEMWIEGMLACVGLRALLVHPTRDVECLQ